APMRPPSVVYSACWGCRRAEPPARRQTLVLCRAGRYAPGVRRPVRLGPLPVERRPAIGPPVHLPESHGRPPQGLVLGRPRPVPVLPTPGGRPLPLPRRRPRRRKRRAERRPVPDDPRRHRPQPGPPLQTIF